MDIKVDDHGSFKRAAAKFHAEAKRLPSELDNAAKQTAEKVKQEIVRSAGSILPRRGGLAGEVSRMDITVEKTANGVRVTAKSKYDIKSMDQGTVRHPVYGNRRVTVSQSINPGFWTRPVRDSEPTFRTDQRKTVQDMAKRMNR